MRRWVGRLLAVCVLIGAWGGASAAAETVQVTIGVGDTVVAITGQTSPDAFVTATRDGSTVGTTTAAADGTYSIVLTAQQPGIYRYGLSADSQRNVHSDEAHVAVNITEHTTTDLYMFLPSTLQLASSSPAYNQPIGASGETAPGAEVLVYIDNVIYSTATADASGNWSASISTASLASGSHQLFAQVVSTVGEQSYPTVARTITIAAEPVRPIQQPSGSGSEGMSTIPDKPVITYPPPSLEWHQPTIVIKGTATPGLQVEVWDGNHLIGSAWVNDSGEWQVPLHLGKEAYDVRARACQAAVCGGFSGATRFRYIPKDPHMPPLHVVVTQSRLSGRQHQPVTMRAAIKDGKAPYKVTLYWGDGTWSDGTLQHSYVAQRHTYEDAGRYTVRLYLQDSTGRTNTIPYTVDIRPDRDWIIPLGSALVSVFFAAVSFWFIARYRRKHRRTAAAKVKQKRSRPLRSTVKKQK